MNRRGFLSSLAIAAAGLALDPEKLLWVPGKKTIFIPPAPPTLLFRNIRAETWAAIHDRYNNAVIAWRSQRNERFDDIAFLEGDVWLHSSHDQNR